MDPKGLFPVCFAVLLLGALLYSNTFQAGFCFDDQVAIVENPALRDAGNLRAIWDAFHTRFIAGLSFALNFAFGKLDPFGYRLFNLLCHIASSFLVYLLALLLLRTPSMAKSPLAGHSQPVALLAAFIFLSHPLQTQAVNYIWQRVACLATLFYLASILLYVLARLEHNRLFYRASIVSMLLAMFTKEIAFTLPFMIVLSEFFFFEPRKGKIKEKLFWASPFLISLVVIPLVLLNSQQTSLELMRSPSRGLFSHLTAWSSPGSLSRKTYLLTEINVLRTYLRLLWMPVRQNLDYDYPLSHHLTEPGVLFSSLLLMVVFAAGAGAFRKNRLVSFGIFWFFITVSLESLIVLPDVIFEHRLYLPMAGFALFLSSSLFALVKNRKVCIAVSCAIVLLCSIAAYHRNEIWKDDIVLWQDVLRKSPKKARPHCALGDVYRRRKEIDAALTYYRKAIELDPAYRDAYNNIGIIYSQKGAPEKAMAYFRKTIRLDPFYAKAYNNLGVLYAGRGRFSTAVSYYQKAIALNPMYDEAYRNLGTVYGEKGWYEEALACYGKAIGLNPADARTYTDVGVIYGKQGHTDQEIRYYQKALACDPAQIETHLNLGIAYMEKGDRASVLRQAERLRELGRRDLADRLGQMVQ